jgi:ribosomal protein S6
MAEEPVGEPWRKTEAGRRQLNYLIAKLRRAYFSLKKFPVYAVLTIISKFPAMTGRDYGLPLSSAGNVV